MEELSKLHPAVACVLVIAIAAFACVLVYSFFKIFR